MSYLVLAPHVSLRRLEEPCLYDQTADELYELSGDAWDFLLRVDGLTSGLEQEADAEFLAYLLEEGLATLSGGALGRRPSVGEQDLPSLRYLELYLTERCNLACRHCFLGDLGRTDLPLEDVSVILEEFDRMGGLRLLLTGGEALLHPGFWSLNEHPGTRTAPSFGFRTVLLSNGTLLEQAAKHLKVQEVQVSLDGLERAHDALRGAGAFARALAGLRAAASAGLQISVATTVNALDQDDFPVLEELVRSLGARSWNVDVPSVSGTAAANQELFLPAAEAAPYLRYSYGGGTHDAASGTECGSHLMAVSSRGLGAKCGFYFHQPVGLVAQGLETLWRRVPRPPAAALDCATVIRCAYLDECHGGCRFRASTYNGNDASVDRVQCCRYGAPGCHEEGGEA